MMCWQEQVAHSQAEKSIADIQIAQQWGGGSVWAGGTLQVSFPKHQSKWHQFTERWKTTALQVPRHKVYRHERVSEIPRINICTQYLRGEVENENCHKWEIMWRGFWEERDTFQLGSVDLEMNCINFGEVILGAMSYMYIFNWNTIHKEVNQLYVCVCVSVCVCVCTHIYSLPLGPLS